MGNARFDYARSLGKLMIILNSLWLYLVLQRLYGQNFGGVLYIFMFPNWLLILECICSLISFILGICILRKQMNVKYGLFVNILLFVICMAISFFITN